MKKFIEPNMNIAMFSNEKVAVTESSVVPETPTKEPVAPTTWGNSIGNIDFRNLQF